MRLMTITASIILGAMTASAALAQQAAPPPAASAPAPAAGKMNTATTTLGDLLDNSGAKAVLTKYAPELTAGGQIDQARGLTLKALQQYIPTLTDEVLGKIDAELAQLK